MKCKDCKHWTKISDFESDKVLDFGTCAEIWNHLEIELDYEPYGGGASVQSIETEEDFFCKGFEARE